MHKTKRSNLILLFCFVVGTELYGQPLGGKVIFDDSGKKIEARLYELVTIYQTEPWDAVITFADQHEITIRRDRRVRIILEIDEKSFESAVENVEYLGLKIKKAGSKNIAVATPLSVLGSLQKIPEVRFIRLPRPGDPDATSQATPYLSP